MEAPADEVSDSGALGGRRRKRVVAGAVVVIALILGVGAKLASDARLTFLYQPPDEATRPGHTVTVQAADGECGPLIVTLHRESILGFWSQTHSGNVIDGFTRDESPWWSFSSTSHFTPIPCSLDGSTTFELPEDVGTGVIAACDSNRRCARVTVDD